MTSRQQDALQDQELINGMLTKITMDGFDNTSLPNSAAIQDRKQRLMERLLVEAQTHKVLRADNLATLSAVEQLKHDITQFHENLSFNQKQQILLKRERDMLEHRFRWTRSDFNTALSTNVLLREEVQNITDQYKQEIGLQNADTKDTLLQLDDVTYYYELITQLNAKHSDLERLVDYLKGDIGILTSLLQHVLSIALDENGLPRSVLSDVFSVIPREDYELLLRLHKTRRYAQVQKTSNEDDGDKDPLLGTTPFEFPVLLNIKEKLSDENFIATASDNTNDSGQSSGNGNVMDSFLTKCVSISGHFQPHIYIQHVRKQSDQLLLLQRSHTLLTSQIFILQQEKALLLTYFESFLKEIVSLKQIIASNNIKIGDDTRTIYSLQQQIIALECELETFQQNTFLDSAAHQIEQSHHTNLIENATGLLDQIEKLTQTLAVTHNTIHKLRTANKQQDEQIQSLEDKLLQSEREKMDLLRIIQQLEGEKQQPPPQKQPQLQEPPPQHPQPQQPPPQLHSQDQPPH